ncbi:hypothetical protein BVY01_01770 [bacterium I07]|nr:hypothetical protein BVY01_01770 [bacterium I07]
MNKRYRFTVVAVLVMAGCLAAQTPVAPGDGTLKAAVDAAAAGDVLELEDGGEYTESADPAYQITVPLTIKAADGAATRPVLKMMSIPSGTGPDKPNFFILHQGSSLTIKGLDLDGGESDTTTHRSVGDFIFFPLEGDLVIPNITIDDCYFHDATNRIINGFNGDFPDAGLIGPFTETVVVKNSMFRHVDKIGWRNPAGDERGRFNDLTIENCTFWDIPDYTIQLREVPGGNVLINHVTFYNCGNQIFTNSSNDDVIRFYGLDWGTTAVKNCIFAMWSPDNAVRGDQPDLVITNCLLTTPGGGPWRVDAAVVPANIVEADPLFADPANGDFTLGAGSPALGAADDGQAIGDLRWAGGGTAVEDESLLPEGFSLEQNYPNPFNPVTYISYSLDKASHTTLTIYNVMGQPVRTLVNERVEAGVHEAAFDASSLESGIYYYQIQSGENTAMKKMVLMK